MNPRDLTRRGLLTIWKRPEPERKPVSSPRPAASARPKTPRAPEIALRPPGALPEQEFLDTCRHCGKCVEACPVQAIGLIGDGPGAGTPVIHARVAPCHLCEGLQCTVACPSGALRALFSPRDVRMGTAVIDPGECLAYQGVACRACNDVCPLPGVIALAPGRGVYVPVAGTENCVGCGLCFRYCPSPDAIRIEPLYGGEAGPLRIEPASSVSDEMQPA